MKDNDVDLYKHRFLEWADQLEVHRLQGRAPFDAVVTMRVAKKPTRYLVEVKRHLGQLDAGVVAARMKQCRAELPREAHDGLLLLAPYVRPQQAAILERAGIDYLDLAGNAHLDTPHRLVHVEGRKPQKKEHRYPGRPQRGWIKTVMALLIMPDLVAAAYRDIAKEAGVALGTVAACMNDLTVRGLVVEGKAGRRVLDQPALLALWVQAYIGGLRPKLELQQFQVMAPDKQALWGRLALAFEKNETRWAITGADAAEKEMHFFRAGETEIYAERLGDQKLMKDLVAQPTTRGGNLWVIEPPGPLAIPKHAGRLPCAPPLLVYAELRFRGTEQANEAAEMILPEILHEPR